MKFNLDIIVEGANTNGYLKKIPIGLYAALSDYKVTDKNEYDINFKNPKSTRDTSKLLMGDELIVLYKDIIKTYPIIPIKGHLDQGDW